jgi:hypothetical protein
MENPIMPVEEARPVSVTTAALRAAESASVAAALAVISKAAVALTVSSKVGNGLGDGEGSELGAEVVEVVKTRCVKFDPRATCKGRDEQSQVTADAPYPGLTVQPPPPLLLPLLPSLNSEAVSSNTKHVGTSNGQVNSPKYFPPPPKVLKSQAWLSLVSGQPNSTTWSSLEHKKLRS